MKIITFYSYKGGVGRTMCLANIAVMLAKWGRKVLMVDWDLEAPGLERYFVPDNFNGKGKRTNAGLELKAVEKKAGLIDLLTEQKPDSWKEALHTIPVPDAAHPLHFISAGQRDKHYHQRVRDFNVDVFYEEKEGGQYVEDLREAWSEAYDFVLIDSRTGVTEINGICTIQMPDLVVFLFTPTNQSFDGAVNIMQASAKAQQKIPYDRSKMLFLPIMSRVESAERELTDEWVEDFAKRLMPFYRYWLPTLHDGVRADSFLKMTKIPHIPYYTFGEKLATIKDDLSDSASMGYAYEGVASLIANKLERVEEFVEQREGFVKLSEISVKTEPPSVYISYSHKDRQITDKVVKYLRSNGLTVVFDTDDMVAGESIEEFIERAQECDYYLLIISTGSLQSGWINYDVNRFLKKGRLNKFIPVRIDSTLFDDDYTIAALQDTHQRMTDLKGKTAQIKKLGGANNDSYLRGDLQRLQEMVLQLPILIETLRRLLVLDISGENFEPSMSKVVKRIKS